tara:strand:+ start:148 stop:336 length:189 start_codon:yes stop_codon:yes gene_type:complete
MNLTRAGEVETFVVYVNNSAAAYATGRTGKDIIPKNLTCVPIEDLHIDARDDELFPNLPYMV